MATTYLDPTDDLRTAINAAGAGDTFVLTAGSYRTFSAGSILYNHASQWLTIQGEPGAVIELGDAATWELYGSGYVIYRCSTAGLQSCSDDTDQGITVQRVNGWTGSRVADENALNTDASPWVVGGNLQYDLVWYDSANNYIYVRPATVPGYTVTDPDTEFRIVGGGKKFALFDSSRVALRDLTFKHSSYAIHTNNTSYLDIRRCHGWSCSIQGFGLFEMDRVNMRGCSMDKLGGQLVYNSDRRDWLRHGLYFTGDNSLIRDCFWGRCYSGTSAAVGSMTGGVTIEDCICYGGSAATISHDKEAVPRAGITSRRNIGISSWLKWFGSTLYDTKAYACHVYDPTAHQIEDSYFEGEGLWCTGQALGTIGLKFNRNQMVSRAGGWCFNAGESGTLSRPAQCNNNVWDGDYARWGRADLTPLSRPPSEFLTYLASLGFTGNTLSDKTPSDHSDVETELDAGDIDGAAALILADVATSPKSYTACRYGQIKPAIFRNW